MVLLLKQMQPQKDHKVAEWVGNGINGVTAVFTALNYYKKTPTPINNYQTVIPTYPAYNNNWVIQQPPHQGSSGPGYQVSPWYGEPYVAPLPGNHQGSSDPYGNDSVVYVTTPGTINWGNNGPLYNGTTVQNNGNGWGTSTTTNGSTNQQGQYNNGWGASSDPNGQGLQYNSQLQSQGYQTLGVQVSNPYGN